MMIKIGNKKIGQEYPVFIIAEAGVNHNGDFNLAKKLVRGAAHVGADAIKFQSFITEDLIRIDAPKAKYQDKNIGKAKSQFDMLKELEMSIGNVVKLKKYAEGLGLIFISTPYDFVSLDRLVKINLAAYKLASMDVVFHPFIKMIARTGKPTILATGMATEGEVKEAVKMYNSNSKNIDNLILLQTNTNYPARIEDQNLRALLVLKKYKNIVGFSDHTIGNEASVAAVALGAKVLERHFTLDNRMKGPDHAASLNPKEFNNFVKAIRDIEKGLGDGIKMPRGGELENIIGMRRSICAKNSIMRGQVIKLDDLAYKRPGNGLVPTEKNILKVIGKRARQNIDKDTNLVNNLLY